MSAFADVSCRPRAGCLGGGFGGERRRVIRPKRDFPDADALPLDLARSRAAESAQADFVPF